MRRSGVGGVSYGYDTILSSIIIIPVGESPHPLPPLPLPLLRAVDVTVYYYDTCEAESQEPDFPSVVLNVQLMGLVSPQGNG